MTRARSTSSCATCRTQRSTATSASRATSTSPQRYVLHYSTHCERELTHPPADLHRVSIASALRWVPTAHTMPRAHSTNVTLVTGSNYQVLFVDPANTTIVYATSGTFSVEAPGSKSFLHNGSLNSGGDASWSPDSHHIRVSPTSCNLVIVPRCEYGPWQLSGMPCPHLFLVSWLLPRQDESKRIGETFRAWHRTCPPVVWGSIEPSLAPLFMDSVPHLARSHPFASSLPRTLRIPVWLRICLRLCGQWIGRVAQRVIVGQRQRRVRVDHPERRRARARRLRGWRHGRDRGVRCRVALGSAPLSASWRKTFECAVRSRTRIACTLSLCVSVCLGTFVGVR